MSTRIQLRRATAAEWTAANPVLFDGEAGVERDTGRFKIGDGVTAWNALGFAAGGGAGPGLPTGGTAGQAPVKQSGTDYDTAWTDVATQVELDAEATARAALDAAAVHKAGAETVTGAKNFTGGLTIAGAAAETVAGAQAKADAAQAAAVAQLLGGLPPALLDTITELATQLQADESAASALANALATETTNRLAGDAAKLDKAANLSDVASAATARSNIGAVAVPTQGTLVARPAAATFGVGWYFATNVNGGTLYYSDGSTWTQWAPGVTEPSGLAIAGPAQLTAFFDVKAVGTTATDVTAMSLNVPASSRPVLLRAKLETQMNTGTAAVASQVTIQVQITDASNNVLAIDPDTAAQITASARVHQGKIFVEYYLAAPVSAATYKLRAKTSAAVPANWTSAVLLPAVGGGASPADNFYAITL